MDVRLNRGALNVSGEYVPPASVEAQNGSPRESLGVVRKSKISVMTRDEVSRTA